MKKVLSLVYLLIAAVAFAQPNIVLSPQSIVINPKAAFEVDVWVDKDPSGDNAPSYQIGEAITINVRVTEAAYVYLYNVRSNGEIDQILPNRYDGEGQSNFLQAGETKSFPPPGARYNFNVDGPTGLDKVIAVASKEQLDTRQLADFRSDPNFASSSIGEQGFAQTLSIIVTPKPSNSWVTDTALFYVGSRPSVPSFGTLSIDSNPRGAQAYVDGQFVGYTPVRFGTRSGTHEVEVRQDGYETFRTSVNLAGGQITPVNATLSQVQRNGTVRFTSQPEGAQVFVDGQYIGVTPTAQNTFAEGTYQVRFSRSGYQDATSSFTVRAGANQTVNADLRPMAGTLVVRANLAGALVFINGNQVGTIPSGSGVLTIRDLPAGSHELVVISPNFRTHVSDFSIRAGSTTDVSVVQGRR